MNDKTTVTQRQMLQQALDRYAELLAEVRELTRSAAKRTEQIDRLIEFERRLLVHTERMAKALEQSNAVQIRKLRQEGPFNSRRNDDGPRR